MKKSKKKPNFFERIISWLDRKAVQHNQGSPTRKLAVDKEIERMRRRVPGS
jgi:hypothetical protein